MMDELNEILKPSWGAEKWILEGWNQITAAEKMLIKARIDELFKDGLPFELKHDKLFYIYTFSLLAQLEVLAVQVPLKFESRMTSPAHKELMHVQLLDEIFHGLVFTKIVYLLCSPHALPPAYNENIETLCNFIRNEECPKVAVVLLNLIGEGWIEEIFYSLQKQNIAPNVFSTIIDDEHRHVSEAELYREIGLPEMDVMRPKLAYLEEQLLTNIFFQYKYIFSVCTLLGADGTIDFLQSLDKKHREQLSKINLVPSEMWQMVAQMGEDFLPKIQQYAHGSYEIEMSPIRKVFLTQWDNPSDPTMAGEFNINVTCLGVFDKKYPPETITTLMLQTISQGLANQDSFRNFLSHKKLYQSKEAYAAIVVKLPDCGDHIGAIVFENCHKLTVQVLAARIRHVLQMMVYCYKKREQMEKEHPHLALIVDSGLYDFSYGLYPYPIPGNAVVSLSNIGSCGYTQAKSPLRTNESMKFTLFEVERRQVWNKVTKEFEVQDLLPVSISADHRIFDGNLPIPKITAKIFQEMYERMETDIKRPMKAQAQDPDLIQMLEKLIAGNMEMGYKLLTTLQTMWPDFISFDEMSQNE